MGTEVISILHDSQRVSRRGVKFGVYGTCVIKVVSGPISGEWNLW